MKNGPTLIPDADALKKATPALHRISETDLKDHYGAHEDLYKTAEKRKFAVLVIDPKGLEKKFKFSEKEIKAAYEQQLDAYAVPEKRDIQVFNDKDWRKVKMINKLFEQKKPHPKAQSPTFIM